MGNPLDLAYEYCHRRHVRHIATPLRLQDVVRWLRSSTLDLGLLICLELSLELSVLFSHGRLSMRVEPIRELLGYRTSV